MGWERGVERACGVVCGAWSAVRSVSYGVWRLVRGVRSAVLRESVWRWLSSAGGEETQRLTSLVQQKTSELKTSEQQVSSRLTKLWTVD